MRKLGHRIQDAITLARPNLQDSGLVGKLVGMVSQNILVQRSLLNFLSHTCTPSIVPHCLLSFWRTTSRSYTRCWKATAKDKVTYSQTWISPLTCSRRLMLAKALRYYIPCDTKQLPQSPHCLPIPIPYPYPYPGQIIPSQLPFHSIRKIPLVVQRISLLFNGIEIAESQHMIK